VVFVIPDFTVSGRRPKVMLILQAAFTPDDDDGDDDKRNETLVAFWTSLRLVLMVPRRRLKRTISWTRTVFML